MEVFDLDSGTDYEPVTVRFRGKDYVLGKNAGQLLAATRVYEKAGIELGEEDSDAGAKVLDLIRPMVAVLCPDFPLDELDPQAEVRLIRPVTEVLTRMGNLTFQEE
jgi:hypothetical protein